MIDERAVETRVDLSIIIPVVERWGDLKRLYQEYSAEIESLGKTAEFIFVVDNRQQEVIPTLRQLQADSDQPIELLLLAGRFGESTSLMLGWARARGEIIVTLASYFQLDPAGLGKALALVESGTDLVVGNRSPRRDSLFNRAQTRVFHWIVNRMTKASFHDISCGFRVMRREVVREVSVYGGLHRFLPLLAVQQGFKVEELPIAQREEDVRTRYYGIALYVKRLLDILTVFFLLKFTKRPLRFFGVLGLLLSTVGLAITGYLGIYRILQVGPIADRPLLLLGVLLMVLGIQTLSLGLVGEIIIFTHAGKIRDYRVAEIVESPGRGGESQDLVSGEVGNVSRPAESRR